MKKITIGRGRECDIRLDQAFDKISRKHAVITITPSGKMKIYDTSSNGTFVNGVQVEKPNGVSIKRGDKINFAYMADLNWNKVKNPYTKIFITWIIIILLIGAGVAAYFLISSMTPKKTEIEPAPVEEVIEVDDLELETPVEKSTPSRPAPSGQQSKKGTTSVKPKVDNGIDPVKQAIDNKENKTNPETPKTNEDNSNFGKGNNEDVKKHLKEK